MNIITISREFGSGGRELGKRLADLLGYDYYDSEIIAAIAEKSGLDKGYIEKALDQHGWQNYPITFHSSFMSPSYTDPNRVELLLDQKTVLEEIAAQGKNSDFRLRRDGGQNQTLFRARSQRGKSDGKRNAPQDQTGGQGPRPDKGDSVRLLLGRSGRLSSDHQHYRLGSKGAGEGAGRLHHRLF